MDTGTEQSLSRAERRAARRARRGEEQARLARRGRVKRAAGWALAAVAVAGGLWFAAEGISRRPSADDRGVVTRSGLHWHPELAIYIKGVKQDIPEGIGLGLTEQPIHTHDASGVIHLEFPGLVTAADTELGQFFKIWGKIFNANCIFDRCNGPDGHVKMFVNGQPSTEFEHYRLKDGDKIEIRYE